MSINAQFGGRPRDIRAAECSAAEAVGDLVCIYDDPPNGYDIVRKADPSDFNLMPAVGVVISKTSPTRCFVQWSGETPALFTGLSSGEIYFLGANAKLAELPPVPGPSSMFVQTVAVATSPTKVYVKPENNLTLRVP